MATSGGGSRPRRQRAVRAASAGQGAAEASSAVMACMVPAVPCFDGSEDGIMLYDVHTHTQPSAQAADEFFSWLPDVPRINSGTLEELHERMRCDGIERTLIVPWLPAQDLVAERVSQQQSRDTATVQVLDQWRRLNAWAAAGTSMPTCRSGSTGSTSPGIGARRR